MAEILALGLTHYPPLAGPDDKMSGILKMMLKNPHLPDELRQPGNWPEGMRAEWGEDEGTAAAGHHREQLVGWLRKTRQALDEFRPDFVLIWGDDQYENFKEDIIPPYCISAHPSFEFGPWANNIWNEPVDKLTRVDGNVAAGKYLATKLIENGFDAAYSYKPLHHPLGHAFVNAVHFLDYDRRGFNYPILPFSVNCYGRHVIAQKGGYPQFGKQLSDEELDPPAPSAARFFDLGAATARILTESPWRVAILASSSWGHAFLTPKNNFLYPDIQADRQLYEAFRTGDYQVLRNYPSALIEESGQQEVLNWACLAGALSELGRKPKEIGLVESWIFNSSKCFLVAPPETAAI